MKLDLNYKHTLGTSLWKKIKTSPKHGICAPLFSLHTKQSCGIGEFLDLLPLITWCKEYGFHVIQLLPLNDTGDDTSPYNCISSVALNPIHLSLSRLPLVKNMPHAESKLQEMQHLCQYTYVPYKILRPLKWDFLYHYYLYNKQIGTLNKNDAFLTFCEQERYWLHPYTMFRAIKKHLKGIPVYEWPKPFIRADHISQFSQNFSDDCQFYAFLQFLCFQQLSQVKQFADKKSVLLQGDLPILISKDSCDVWFFRQYFSSASSVGAPPDMYNKEGQNWQFPIYNMNHLAKDNYIWWKKRLRYAENFYSLYRLDHIAGFYRLWIWDKENKGYFYPDKEEDYLKQGEQILLQLLKASSMLPIGEDLGDVPSSIKDSLKKLGICGMKIPRWERIWSKQSRFIPFDQYSPLSVTSLSTHDSDTLAGWWKYSTEEAKDFSKFLGIKYSKILSSEKQFHIMQLSHKTSSIFHINLINDYLALHTPFVSSEPNNERINTPGMISNKNWVYRVKPSLEELTSNSMFNLKIDSLF